MDGVNQEIHFPIFHFLYHCFCKNGNLIKYMLLLLSLRFCLIIYNVRWIINFSERFIRLLVALSLILEVFSHVVQEFHPYHYEDLEAFLFQIKSFLQKSSILITR